MRYFKTIFLREARDFLDTLHPKAIRKVLYNMDLAEQTKDVSLFKKLTDEIWEFRTRYAGLQIRFLAFWEKKNGTLVVATHGFVKKVDKVPGKEIDRALTIKEKYEKTSQ